MSAVVACCVLVEQEAIGTFIHEKDNVGQNTSGQERLQLLLGLLLYFLDHLSVGVCLHPLGDIETLVDDKLHPHLEGPPLAGQSRL